MAISKRMSRHGRRGAYSHCDGLMPTALQMSAALEAKGRIERNIKRMSRSTKPGMEENLERLFKSTGKSCCVPDCGKKAMMWTPKGMFCFKHREEAIAMFKKAAKERYGS